MAQRRQAHDDLIVVERMSGDAVVLSAAGTIDMVTAPQFQQHTDTVLQRRPTALIIDLRRVEFLASAGIGVLMRINNAANGMAYAVVAEGPATARPFATARHRQAASYIPDCGRRHSESGRDWRKGRVVGHGV